ncbi:hypothetical protein [Salibacterium lacus]|uniref:S-layer homology domain-containing protein n=1 Tax=Salibacterium lacus TaxID=1898109 RepID=A0ABW5T3U6_9BACI
MKRSGWMRTLLFIGGAGLLVLVVELFGSPIRQAAFAQVDMEERFDTFLKNSGFTEEDISEYHGEDGSIQMNITDDLHLKQTTERMFLDRENTPLRTQFSGPADQQWLEEYVALLKYSMESPEETGFAFEDIVRDIIEQENPVSEYYFVGDIRILVQHYQHSGYENGIIDAAVQHHLLDDRFYFGGVSALEEAGMEKRLQPHPKFLEITGNNGTVSEKVDQLIRRGHIRMNGYIEYGDREDLSYYNHLDKTLQSLLPRTERALKVVEDKTLKKDLKEVQKLMQGLKDDAADMENYAQNESIQRLAEIFRDLNYYVRGEITSERSNTTHFAEKVKENLNNKE